MADSITDLYKRFLLDNQAPIYPTYTFSTSGSSASLANINTENKESNGMKTIMFTVDDKQYSVQQEKSVISIGRISEVAGVDTGLQYFDKDGELVDASDYYQANRIPQFYSEEYLSD